jgi:hypothetical protein
MIRKMGPDKHLRDSTKPENLPPITDDRRESTRRRVVLGGIIANRDGTLTWDCLVKDISAAGARIGFSFDQIKTFDQTIPTDCIFINLRDGIAYQATVEWRRDPLYGLKFIESFELEGQVSSNMLFAKMLWLERRRR